LTRFDDGVSPAERFADAHIVGLGIELECATAAAALRAAEPLPEGTFLNLNFSAAAILGGSAAEVVRGSRRCIVIEITEHELLHDFAAVRHAISQIENCELAIDDFGAGFTTLVEIVELLPRFLKLDISMIHEVDTVSYTHLEEPVTITTRPSRLRALVTSSPARTCAGAVVDSVPTFKAAESADGPTG